MDLFRTNPWVDSITGYSGRYRGGLGMLGQMKSQGYDLCLVFHDSDPCPVQSAFLSGIPFIFRIGQRDEKVRRWLSARIPYDREKHAIDQRLEVIRRVFGVSLKDPEDLRMDLPADPEASRRLWARILKGRGLTLEESVITGLQFAASGTYKEWPSENFALLAHHLLKASDNHIICLVGGPSDKKRAEEIRAAIRDINGSCRRVLNLAGDTELSRFAELILGMDLLVSNDTGPLHVAIAVGTPTISLFVPSNASATGPVQDLHLHRVITRPKPCRPCVEKYCKRPDCMGLITVDEVVEAATDRLAHLHRLGIARETGL